MEYTTNCELCGKEFSRQISKKRYDAGILPKYCSRECMRSKPKAERKKTIKNLCLVCGITFYTRYKKQKYCSNQCFGVSARSATVYRNCVFCGKEFEVGKHKDKKYCSSRCFYDSRIKNKPAILSGVFECEQCGKEYTLPRTGKAKYIPKNLCSYQCRADFFGYSNPDNKTVYICQWCGKEFEEWTYRNRVFCSRQCMSEYGARQPKPNLRKPENFVTLKCKVCGKEYTVHNIYINRIHKNGKVSTSSCCSLECQGVAKSESMIGENNPNYIDGSGRDSIDRGDNWGSQRRKALRRDFHTCRVCGTGYNTSGIIIDVHHIKPYRLFNGDFKKANRLSNLITLCRKCHSRVEHGKIPCPKP